MASAGSGLIRLVAAAAVAAVMAVTLPTTAHAGPTQAYSRVLGMGSTYVGVAMQQWVAEANVAGIPVQYQTTGSPDGLNRFNTRTVDFAGTEAEFSSLGLGDTVDRGYQYIPDIAGAVAIMYNVSDQAGRKIDYLHLSRGTVAKIFMGYITRWSDPQISADNRGLVLPDEAITVVYRASPSGTTALFYDFVANMEPGLYDQWVGRMGHPQGRILMPISPIGVPFGPTEPHGSPDSDAAARTVAGMPWTIGYDEYAYPKHLGVPVAWIENQAGQWVLPYAENISAALDGATLRPDLSQELSTVYTNPDPKTYPISAYSYVVSQCAPTGERATCLGPYGDAGVAETMAAFLDHIACEGQINAAELGYSPLPPHLSQEVINSIGRMKGVPPPRQLGPDNCSNPRFHGRLGDGSESPEDPLANVDCIGSSCDAQEQQQQRQQGTGAQGPAAAVASDTTELATGRGGVDAVGGGSQDYRRTRPVGYDHEGASPLAKWGLLVLLGLLSLPPLVGALRSRRRA